VPARAESHLGQIRQLLGTSVDEFDRDAVAGQPPVQVGDDRTELVAVANRRGGRFRVRQCPGQAQVGDLGGQPTGDQFGDLPLGRAGTGRSAGPGSGSWPSA
jgi:hypothetical protein